MRESSRINWRWVERDYGFRFKEGSGKRVAEYYQASRPGEFYTIPLSHRKWDKNKTDSLCALIPKPTAPTIVANPWHDYGNSNIQHIATHDGETCLNLAGCLDTAELNERETHGVNRAKTLITDLAQRDEPVAINLDLIRLVHLEMFGDIYPWAGEWRTVSLHKGEGATRWPLPPYGMEPILEQFASDVLCQTPFICDDDDAVINFLARFLGEYLALHPFREGNGRSAFIIGDLILLQNGLATLDIYNRRRDEARYFEACDAARLCNYAPLATLLEEWQAERQAILAQQLGESE